MSTSVETMKNFFNILKLYSNDTTTSGVAMLDHAIRTTTRFAGLQDTINHFVSDMAYVTTTQGAAQSLLQNCGIVLGADYDFTADTGAVSGYNAGMGVVKNAQTIVPEPAVLLSQMPLPAVGSRTVHSYTGADGQTFYFTITYPENYLTVTDNATSPLDENGYPESTYAETTTLQAGQLYQTEEGSFSATTEQIVAAMQTIIRGFENFWASEGLKLAYDSFGLDFNNKNLSILFGINQSSQAETGPIASDTDGMAGLPAPNIEMEINAVLFAGIDPNNPNGNNRVEGGANTSYLDRTIAHELIHAVMQGSGTLKNDTPEFFREGVAELVQGLDDFDSKVTQTIAELAQDSARLTQALALHAGFMTADAYPGGYMFLRYICQQSLPTEVTIGNGNIPGLFEYDGGEEILSGVASGSQINVAEYVELSGTNTAGDDLFVTSNLGTLIIRDARAKLINFADADGDVATRFCAANAAGTLDGRELDGYEIIYGADFANNDIYANGYGSQLWGGSYGMDNLVGGEGVDEFIAGVGCGADTIFNAGMADTINLAATTLDQISSVNVVGSGIESDIMMSFTDGSSLTVWSFPGQIVNFRLADGSEYSHVNATDTWINTN